MQCALRLRFPLVWAVLSLLHCFAWADSTSVKDGITPVMQVLQMMADLSAKGKKDKHEEQVAFAAFTEFCDHTSAEKKSRIEEAGQKLEHLEAMITKAEADAAKLGDEIAVLNSDIEGWEAESATAKALRDKENGEFEVTHADYTESIDALMRAISVLKSKGADVPQTAPELLELRKVKQLPQATREALQSFMQERSVSGEAAPEANAYEFQSTSIVGMLEKLLLQFEDEMHAVEKTEMNRKHAFELMSERWHDDITYAERTKAEKTTAKAEREQEAADAKGEHAEVTAAKEADEKYLRDLIANCQLKSEEFEKRQKLRQGELDAMAKAIEIISSPDVAGLAATHLPTLLQTQRRERREAQKVALVQTSHGQSVAARGVAQVKVAAFLKQRAVATGSNFLSTLAARAAEDPFEKVKKMIKDLLVKLMEEANSEAEHKAWCDTELSRNKVTRDELSAAVEDLTSKIDEMTALIATLTEEYAELQEAIAELDAAVKAATEAREKEKETNTATITDAQTAQAAVQSALTVLKEFYAAASESTALLQKRQDPVTESPTTWDTPYTGMQDSKGGVIGMIEVIQSDFARVEADTKTDEAEAERAFVQFTQDSEVDRAVKDKEMRHKGYKKDSTLRFRAMHQKDLETYQKELTAALDYYDKLKPDCVDLGLSYEARVQAREEELQSLKEALAILNGEELA